LQNIEFKAELRDRQAARAQCRQLGGTEMGTLRQTDVYYKLQEGRLKRRIVPGEAVEWIYYHRPDCVTPQISNYTILNDHQAQMRWGIQKMQPWRTVVKTRELWLVGDVRVHLDEVDGLGCFIEFEAPVTQNLDAKACHSRIAKLRSAFGSTLGEHIAVSYCDLHSESESTSPA
jgi:adenylate cyclase class IV